MTGAEWVRKGSERIMPPEEAVMWMASASQIKQQENTTMQVVKLGPDGKWTQVEVEYAEGGLAVKDRKAARQFVVKFKCGCCVRLTPLSGDAIVPLPHKDSDLFRKPEHSKCDMANGCYFSEEAVQYAIEGRGRNTFIGAPANVTWGWGAEGELLVRSLPLNTAVTKEILEDSKVQFPATIPNVAEKLMTGPYLTVAPMTELRMPAVELLQKQVAELTLHVQRLVNEVVELKKRDGRPAYAAVYFTKEEAADAGHRGNGQEG